jgi:hypothetical protein
MMFVRAIHACLEREENVVGLIDRTAHDVYRCPRCFLLHWAARPARSTRLAS